MYSAVRPCSRLALWILCASSSALAQSAAPAAAPARPNPTPQVLLAREFRGMVQFFGTPTQMLLNVNVATAPNGAPNLACVDVKAQLLEKSGSPLFHSYADCIPTAAFIAAMDGKAAVELAAFSLLSPKGQPYLLDGFSPGKLRLSAVTAPNPNGGGVVNAKLEVVLRDGAFPIAAQLTEVQLPAGATNKLSIGNYNAENFWDDNPTNTPNPYDDYSPTKSNYYKDRIPALKAHRIAHALILAGVPDVVALQEIESANNASRSLQNMEPELKALGYRYFALGKQQPQNPVAVTTGFVSKYPILLNANLPFVGQEEESSRDPQVVMVGVAGKTVRLYNGHWKSKRGSKPGEQGGDADRLAIANLVRKDIDSQPQGLDIVLMGDFNSQYFEPSHVRGLRGTGDEREMLTPMRSPAIYNLWFEMAPTARCSYSFSGLRQCIDHLYVNDALYDNKGLQYIDNSFRMLGRNGGLAQRFLMNSDGTPLRWQTRKDANEFTTHVGLGFSDHLPLIADFFVLENGNSPVQKVQIQRPTVENITQAPRTPDIVPTCNVNERILDPETADLAAVTSYGWCTVLKNVSMKIERVSKFGVAVRLKNNKVLAFSMTRAFAENMDFQRNVIQRSAGGTLTAAAGRIGIVDGFPALFVDRPQEIRIEGGGRGNSAGNRGGENRGGNNRGNRGGGKPQRRGGTNR